jgi:hypothetical protein
MLLTVDLKRNVEIIVIGNDNHRQKTGPCSKKKMLKGRYQYNVKKN